MTVPRIAYRVSEVAEMLALSDSQVRRLVDSGRLRKIEGLGARVRISARALIEAFGDDARDVLGAVAPAREER